jgi:hypothetical protein
MFDVIAYAKVLQANLSTQVEGLKDYLKTVSPEELLSVQGKIWGLEVAIREIHDVISQIPEMGDED